MGMRRRSSSVSLASLLLSFSVSPSSLIFPRRVAVVAVVVSSKGVGCIACVVNVVGARGDTFMVFLEISPAAAAGDEDNNDGIAEKGIFPPSPDDGDATAAAGKGRHGRGGVVV